jgi:hypothetical protein
MRLKRLLCLESLLVMINISTFSMSYDYLARSNDQKANTFIFQELSNSEYHMSDIFLNYEKTNDLLLIQSALSVAGFTFFTQNLSYDNDELKMIQYNEPKKSDGLRD